MKRLPIIATAFAALVAVSFAADVDLTDVKCVMNPKAAAKADKSLDYKGGKVYFCCNNCPKGFASKIKAGDKVVAAKGNKQLVETGQAKQAKCPFSDGPLNEKLTVAGAEVQFCCNKCKGKAEKLTGQEQVEEIFGEKAFEKGKFKPVKHEIK